MGEPVNIFIASHHTAETLAQKLADKIRDYRDKSVVELRPTPWWRIPKGDFILTAIRKEMKKCDFAAVFLTRSDLGIPPMSQTGQNSNIKPRNKKVLYNPTFEAGLFVGDVDDHERCFLLTSCDEDELPSDLRGLIYIPVTQAASSEDSQKENDSIEVATSKIYEKVQIFAQREQLRAARGLRCTLLSVHELYSRETTKAKKGQLEAQGAVIFINTPKPREWQDEEFAIRVVDNMVTERFRYTYCFSEYQNLREMGIGIVFIFSALKKFSKSNFDKNLATIAENLNIYFTVAYDGLEFCIHDADSGARAKCYMQRKLPGHSEPTWMNWVEGPQAASFLKLIDLIKDKDENWHRRIFHNTTDALTRILEDEYRSLTDLGKELKRGIETALEMGEFSQPEKQNIMDACFYGMKDK